jgi:hypothetical protein
MVGKPVAKDRLHIVLDGRPDLCVSLTHVEILSFTFDVGHLTFDVLFLPVISDDAFQGCGVIDPFDQARISA